MMILVHGNATSIEHVRAELPPSFQFGQLISPANKNAAWPGTFAVDNGAYRGFDRDAFTRLLARELPNRRRCLFVAAPDVVGSARETLQEFERWRPSLEGWPVALVAQDGLEDLDVPWPQLSALFIGGSTTWKLSNAADTLIRVARARGKWTHVGRVNTAGRIEKFLAAGVDSIDGASLSRHGAGYTRDRRRATTTLTHPRLFAAYTTSPT